MIFRGAPPADKTVLQRAFARLAQVGEKVVSSPLGQILCRGIDRLLWTLEASVQWFVDPDDPRENGSSAEAFPRSHLVRPLPWVLFLPLLVCLRLLKMTADLVTTLTGKEPLHPARVVRFLRVRRRRLRAVKYQGLKNFQSWQQAELDIRQSGKRKTLDEDNESSDEYEDLLEKIKRMCHNYASDEDPDYEPNEDEESHNSESSEEELEANECQLTTVTEAKGNILPTPEINTVTPTSEPENQRAVSIPPDTATHQTTMTTSDAVDMQPEGEVSSPKIHTIIIRNPEAVSANDDGEKYQNEGEDDSSSTVSLDSTEPCSESTSQTFYSPLNSGCVTPEPKPSAETQKTQFTESAMTVMPTEVESQSADQSISSVSLPTSTQSNSTSITSGSTSSLTDFNEDTKAKSKLSSFFQIKKKSLSQDT